MTGDRVSKIGAAQRPQTAEQGELAPTTSRRSSSAHFHLSDNGKALRSAAIARHLIALRRTHLAPPEGGRGPRLPVTPSWPPPSPTSSVMLRGDQRILVARA